MLPRIFRTLTQISKRKTLANLEAKRNSSTNYWVYRREPVAPEKWRFYAADGMNAFMWWWFFVHLWYQFGHVVGEFDYPEPEKWTDAELGVVDIDD
ncbi:uncharacterized protein TNIN_127701 [Trichonephila inaurata madagascariensis]|uniref:NADH dehydrogenase [ubiquinone] 1 beta subcomplex subunit 2, mitochondrial n=1 Tax=Trichonephila inaurata madagascariensis TaxID=2747483 RepID=A0A8X6YVN0_9ARAC|nr:uncharacterized protein TNIN_127701 [Trichonephila inaurata madagascariensis]